jgi:hypothetical protein
MKRPPARIALIGGVVLFAISFYIGYHGRHSATPSGHVVAHISKPPPAQ